MAIDHSDIDNDVGVCEAQFIDDYGVGTGMKPLQFLLVQGSAYLWVGAHLSAALEHTGRFQSLSVGVPYLRVIAKLKIILVLSYAPQRRDWSLALLVRAPDSNRHKRRGVLTRVPSARIRRRRE